MILSAGTSHTVAVLRVTCFAIWLGSLVEAPLPRLAELPADIHQAIGVLTLVPAPMMHALLRPTGSWILQALLVLGVCAVMLGVRPHRLIALPTAVLLMVADGIGKGYGGSLSHAQFAPLYLAVLLALLPSSDVLSVCGRSATRRSPRFWAFAAFALALVISIPYSLVGARRIATGIDVFYGDHMTVWLATRSLSPATYDFRAGLMALDYPWLALAFKAGFVIVTAAEVLTPLALLNDRFRLAWLAVIIPFQVVTLFTMNIFFWQNVILILVLFTAFAYRIGAPAAPGTPIVFYDGVCGLCDRFVRWVHGRDVERVFRFAPLQGETAAARLGPQGRDDSEWSVVLLDGNGRHERSEAVLRIACALGGGWGVIASALRYVPRPLRDAAYRFVAARRHAWFERVDSCPLPTAQQRRVMLP